MKLKRLPSKLIILTFILMSIATANTFAQQAKKISIQGFLKDGTGKAVADAFYDITFKLYTTETGGTAAWTGTQNIKVTGGVYSAYLGAANNPIDALNWGFSTYFVGVTIGTDELTPRTELTFAPYSLGSPKAQEVVCSGAVGDVKYSILNPTQFAAVNGDCWVPMDGRGMTGSKLATILGSNTLPDISGAFVRSQEFAGKADRDPERTSSSTIATLQDESFKSHNHGGSTSNDGQHNHGFSDTVPDVYQWNVSNAVTGNSKSTYLNEQNPKNDSDVTDLSTNHTHAVYSDGGSETRPKNLNLWTYIRIN